MYLFHLLIVLIINTNGLTSLPKVNVKRNNLRIIVIPTTLYKGFGKHILHLSKTPCSSAFEGEGNNNVYDKPGSYYETSVIIVW